MEETEKHKIEAESRELHARLEKKMFELDIEKEQRNSLLYHISLLDNYDRPTANHSIRVGLKGAEVAEHIHIIEPKALFYPGILHDIGKSRIRKALLEKRVGWTNQDSVEMEDHVIFGFNIIKDIHKYSAYVSLFHHHFHGNYPRVMPPWPKEFSAATRAIVVYSGNLLSLIDSWDAASTRKNDKFSPGNPRLLTREEVKKSLLSWNLGQEYLINNLYRAGLF
jgi:hypothetical protein